MFRNIVYSTCCAVSLLVGVVMVLDVVGMDKTEEFLRDGCDIRLRDTLAISFPCRIRNLPILNHDNWIISFEKIETRVAFLVANESCSVMNDLMQTISAFSVPKTFRSLCEFLSSLSDSCPVSSTVSGLSQLIYRASIEIDEAQNLGISDGFRDIALRNTDGHFGLEESTDLPLFQRFSDALPLEW